MGNDRTKIPEQSVRDDFFLFISNTTAIPWSEMGLSCGQNTMVIRWGFFLEEEPQFSPWRIHGAIITSLIFRFDIFQTIPFTQIRQFHFIGNHSVMFRLSCDIVDQFIEM